MPSSLLYYFLAYLSGALFNKKDGVISVYPTGTTFNAL